MTLVTAPEITVPGTITGTGATIVIDNVADNTLATFAFANKAVKMCRRRAGVRSGRASLRAGRVHHHGRQPRRARAADQGARAARVGDRRGADRADARDERAAHRLHPLVGQHAGRGLVADGVRSPEDSVRLLRRQQGPAGQPAREVRRHRLSADRRHRHHERRAFRPAIPVPYKKTDITPNIGTSPDNTDDTRGGLGRDGLKELVKFMNEGGVLIAEGTPARTLTAPLTQGIGTESAAGSVRAGLGHEDAARRQDEPDSLRLRSERARRDLQRRADLHARRQQCCRRRGRRWARWQAESNTVMFSVSARSNSTPALG